MWQVLTRFVLGNPSSFTDELARYLLIWVGLFGAAYAIGKRTHLAIDLLPRGSIRGRGARRARDRLQGCRLAFALGVMVYRRRQPRALSLLLAQRRPRSACRWARCTRAAGERARSSPSTRSSSSTVLRRLLRGLALTVAAPDGTSAEAFATHQPGVDGAEPTRTCRDARRPPAALDADGTAIAVLAGTFFSLLALGVPVAYSIGSRRR